MFGGAMDPEMFKLAQEQLSRMSPSDLAKIQQQMISNPDLMKMATESMRNMKPEDMRMAAEQFKNTRPEDVSMISEMMANASPADIASMQARVDAQMTYEINAAQSLKNQGNELHNQGRYEEASQKYVLASKNLTGIPSFKAKQLAKTCSLNLMSCYLKTRKYKECVDEGSKVLEDDGKNVKALYRRGQAYKELGKYENAVADLKIALEVSPNDETISLVLRETEECLSHEVAQNRSTGIIIEEITEEVEERTSEVSNDDSIRHSSPERRVNCQTNATDLSSTENRFQSERLSTSCNDLDDLRSFQSYMSNLNPDKLAGLRSKNFSEISPEMFQTATDMISSMPPETFQSVLRMASQHHDENRVGTSDTGSAPTPPTVTPDMLKNVSDMMSSMSPDELQKMFEMVSSCKRNNSVPPVNDPGTRQMFASMMKNISPETLSNMSEQFGFKLSGEDAARAQRAMSSLSPEALEKMMVWSDRIHRGVESARNVKNWLLGKQGMILALCILLLAMATNFWLSRRR